MGTKHGSWGVSEEQDVDSVPCARAWRVQGAGRAGGAVQCGAGWDPGATRPGDSGPWARAAADGGAADGGVAEAQASTPSTRKFTGPFVQ